MRDSRVRKLVCAAAAIAGLALAAPAGAAAASDAATTRAYVQANYNALRVAISHLATSEAAPAHVLEKVKRECPLVGEGSPEDEESTQMSDEVIGAMVVSAIAPDLQAIRTFVHAVAGLSWSDGALTRSIRAYTNKWKVLASLSAPSLCADVKAWGANGYRALPASTTSFVARFMPSWVGTGYLPAALNRYESPATRALAKRCRGMEEQIVELEAREVANYNNIMNALAIWP